MLSAPTVTLEDSGLLVQNCMVFVSAAHMTSESSKRNVHSYIYIENYITPLFCQTIEMFSLVPHYIFCKLVQRRDNEELIFGM